LRSPSGIQLDFSNPQLQLLTPFHLNTPSMWEPQPDLEGSSWGWALITLQRTAGGLGPGEAFQPHPYAAPRIGAKPSSSTAEVQHRAELRGQVWDLQHLAEFGAAALKQRLGSARVAVPSSPHRCAPGGAEQHGKQTRMRSRWCQFGIRLEALLEMVAAPEPFPQRWRALGATSPGHPSPPPPIALTPCRSQAGTSSSSPARIH